MKNTIKNMVEKHLRSYIRHLDKTYSLSKISPLLFHSIKDFVLRKGKRIRPVLLIVGYRGFAKRPAANLYKTALSIELLHDFMLVHDDIIDKSDLRRGRPSMHKLFARYLNRYKEIKFNGQDLAILAGDVMYGLALDAFLAIKEKMARKEKALRSFIRAVIYTGMGEFIELLEGTKKLEDLKVQDIYRIYDYKTAYYTFAFPLAAGATLAGASQKEVNRLYKYGIYLGRAFQIQDDILGIFGKEKQLGKSIFTDLQESKRTILILYALNRLNKQNKLFLKRILKKDKIAKSDLLKMQNLFRSSGALDSAKKEITDLLQKAKKSIKPSAMHRKYKALLNKYAQQIINIGKDNEN